MGTKQTGVQLLNLALRREGRVNDVLSRQSKGVKPDSAFVVEAESFTFSYWLGCALLLQDHPCTPGVVGSFKRLLHSVLEERDLLGYIDSCSQVREVLVSHGIWKDDLFKGLRGRWVRGLTSAVRTAVPTSLCVHPSRLFDTVVTFLGWLKRLPVQIRAESISIESYLECEKRLSSIKLEDNVYVTQLVSIWREWFGSFHLTLPFEARHGSGSTADAGRIRSRKWDLLKIDTVADVCFRDASLNKVLDWPKASPKREAKVVFVPKQAGKDRTICMEPAWLQFLQQGVARQLVSFSHSHWHPLSKLINVFNQDNNRALCARAFVEDLATIDLSDASDSVSYELIKRLTHGLPLARFLHGSRSTFAMIGDLRHELVKFAPMGSALCFITECFVFASVVELAYRIHYGQASRGNQSGCSVYGDDIICPSEIYHLVVDILTSIGFIVNSQKSFSEGPYYESCGVEYLYGARITTIRHPRTHLFARELLSPDSIGMITDLANTLYENGYFLARRILLKYASEKSIKIGKHSRPVLDLIRFDDKNCIPVLESYSSSSFDHKIQRRVRKVWSCEPVTDPGKNDYLQWLYDTRLPQVDRFGIHPKWSTKAISCLTRFGHYDLLRDGEIQSVRTCRTGRLRYRFRRRNLIL